MENGQANSFEIIASVNGSVGPQAIQLGTIPSEYVPGRFRKLTFH